MTSSSSLCVVSFVALGSLRLFACSSNPSNANPVKQPAAGAPASSSDVASGASAPAASGSAPAVASATSGLGSAPAAPSLALSDDAVRHAVTNHQNVLLVRVKQADPSQEGRRSEAVVYTLDVIATLFGDASGSLKLSREGASQLVVGKAYAITTRGGNPLHGTKAIKDVLEVPAGQETAAVEANKRKVDALAR